METRDLGQLLGQAMTEGIRLLEAVQNAEAERHRIERDLSAAKEKVEIARARYESNRTLAMDIWQTLRKEIETTREPEAPST